MSGGRGRGRGEASQQQVEVGQQGVHVRQGSSPEGEGGELREELLQGGEEETKGETGQKTPDAAGVAMTTCMPV